MIDDWSDVAKRAGFGGLQLEAIFADVAAKSLFPGLQPEMVEVAHPGRTADLPEGVDVAVADPAQFSKRMPSLKLDWVSRTNARSSMPSSWWKVRAVGMVDSPTPIVPISSDSTRMMSSRGPSCRPSAAATIQPAVPPPAMTTRLIAGSSATLVLPVSD